MSTYSYGGESFTLAQIQTIATFIQSLTHDQIQWEFQQSFRTFAGWQLALQLGVAVFSNTNAVGEKIQVGPTVPPKINGGGS